MRVERTREIAEKAGKFQADRALVNAERARREMVRGTSLVAERATWWLRKLPNLFARDSIVLLRQGLAKYTREMPTKPSGNSAERAGKR